MFQVFKKKKIWLLITILAFVTFSITFTSLLIVYKTSISTVKHVLMDLAEGQNSLINSLVSNDICELEIINIIKKSNNKLVIGETGEFVMAKKTNDSIHFILCQNPYGQRLKRTIPAFALKDIPMQLALNKQSGFIKSTDYDGDNVFAGYTFNNKLNWGIVALVNVSEIQYPFVQALYLSFGLAVLLISVGAFLFIKITNPLLEKTYLSEKKLRQSEEQLRRQFVMLQSIINSTDQPIFTIDTNYCFINFNHSYAEMIYANYGIEVDLGQSILTQKDIIEDFEKYRIFLEKAQNGVQSVKEISFGKDKSSLYHLEIACNPIRDINNIVIGVAVFAKDITKRKNAELALKSSEEKFRTLIENFPLPVVIKDKSGLYEFANEQFKNSIDQRLLPAEGKTDFDFFPFDIAEKISDNDNLVIENLQTMTFDMEFELNDKLRYLVVTKMPIKENDGTIHGILCVHLNLTELKSIERELRESNASKDKFFSILAHDLRNPLATYKASLVSLTDCYDDFNESERIEFLHLMRKSSEHLYELLENLLTWAKLQNNTILIKSENINIHSLIDISIQSHMNDLKLKNIQLISNIDNDLIGYADYNALLKVIGHVIKNSIKFSHQDSKINISAVEKFDNIEIAIQDRGIGINPRIVNELFKIDQAQSVPGTQGEKGTGLGLILCREFLDRMGGKIWFDTIYGSGTTFYLSLPKADV